MPKLATCPYCHEVIQKDEPIKKYQNKTYHISCYHKYCDEIYKKSNTSGNDESRQNLYKYICQLFNIKELTPFLDFQLQKIFKEHKFTYSGVFYSLKYFFEVKENPIDINYGVGIVPLIYEEAKNFYIKKRILREKNNSFDCTKQEKTVKIKESKPLAKPLIDISKL